MGLISYSRIERDFPAGIYLGPLGEHPPLDHIESLDYSGDLHLPLSLGKRCLLEPTVTAGQHVEQAQLLARSQTGRYIYAPAAGIVGDQTTVTVNGSADEPALTLHITDPATPTPRKDADTHPHPAHYDPEGIWQDIEQSGCLIPGTNEPLALLLQNLKARRITAVVANATPLEAALNTPLAILHQFSQQVFTGLSILKTWLGATDALLAYPYHFHLDHEPADYWQVRCVPVSEKYPQGRRASILRTLKKQRQLSRRARRAIAPVVFDVQLLRQIERLIFAGQVPTHRVVTIAGDGIQKPSHFFAPIGLPLMELLSRAGLTEDAECIADGSSMAGAAVDPHKTVITPTSERFIAVRHIPTTKPQPCIRCGWCIEYCPARIDPAHLLHLAQTNHYDLALRRGATRCVECGICSYICPSHLKIMDRIVETKAQLSPDDKDHTIAHFE